MRRKYKKTQILAKIELKNIKSIILKAIKDTNISESIMYLLMVS